MVQQHNNFPFVLNNGQLVYGRPNKFSWLRFAVIASTLLVLFVLNPANQESALVKFLIHKNNDRNNGVLLNNNSSTYDLRRTTNYGFFCVKERTIKAVVSVAGGRYEWECPYDHPRYGVMLCQNIIRDNLTHQKPLLLFAGDDDDYTDRRPYTVHRIAAWTVIATALLATCYTRPPVFHTDNVLLDSFLSFFFDDPRSSPLLNALYKLLYLNVIVYRVLQAMDEMVQQQQQQTSGNPLSSIFATFSSTNANYAFSVAVLLLLAVLVNAASKLWSGSFLLRFDAITAVSLGYYAQYHQATTALSPADGVFFSFQVDNNNSNLAWNITLQNVFWTILFTVFSRGWLVSAIVFWCLAYAAGHSLANYQYEHLTYIATARALYSWMESTSSAIEQGIRDLLGMPKQTYWR